MPPAQAALSLAAFLRHICHCQRPSLRAAINPLMLSPPPPATPLMPLILRRFQFDARRLPAPADAMPRRLIRQRYSAATRAKTSAQPRESKRKEC